MQVLKSKTTNIGIIMGSISDWHIMQDACKVLAEFDLAYQAEVVSAHRTPDKLFNYAETANSKNVKVIIAGAGGAAHLPGMIAAKTIIPVIGVPIKSKALNGIDSLLSIVQMPFGIPVATVAINQAKNAALLAIQIIGQFDDTVAQKILQFRLNQTQKILNNSQLPL